MAKRQVEVLTAGCPICEPAVQMVNDLACPDREVTVHDTREAGAEKAAAYEIKTLPTVVVDGRVVSCCDNRGPDRSELEAEGIGQAL